MTTTTAFDHVLDKLTAAGRRVEMTGEGNAKAQCPAHEDHNPSLTITRTLDRVLVNCHASCDTDEVLAALDLTRADLFDEPLNGNGHKPVIVVATDYTDETGALLYQNVRYVPKDFRVRRPDGHGGWIWNIKGVRNVLLRLPKIIEAVAAGKVIHLVEGEKDVLAMESIGAIATTAALGAKSFHKVDATPLYGADVVAVVDNDSNNAGRDEWVPRVRKQLDGLARSLTFVQAVVGKDTADHVGAGHGVDDFIALNLDPTTQTDVTFEETSTEEEHHRSWQRVDLTDVLAGRYVKPTPTVGARSDGPGLFYPGRVHTIASESEGGKTWLALASARVELDAGNAVVYLDFEDDEGGVVGRLMALGASRESIRDRFAYVRPEDSFRAIGNREDLEEILFDLHPTLAVLDGVTEAMTLHNLEMKDNTEIAQFGQLLPRWIANHGPACVALDHVVKDRENRGRYAIGGVHKLNGINGAAYVLENRTPFTVGGTGRSTVYISKDRPGGCRRHALPGRENLWWFADLAMTSHNDEFVEVSLPPPVEQDENFRPTILMAKIAAALTLHGPLSQRKILAVVKGRNATAISALTFLQLDGYVTDKTPHELLKPYLDGGDSV